MKRILALFLLINIAVLFTLSGCSGDSSKGETTIVTAATTASVPPTTQPKTTVKETTTAPTETSEVIIYETVAPAPLYAHDQVTNILLIGTDSKSDWGRSDTLMLLSLDNIHGKIKLTSFLRDTLVSIPGYSPDKLNAAYAYGGTSLCIDTIEYNFGVQVDGYAILNFATFKNLINAVGGIDVYLTQDEINYINAQVAQNGQKCYLPEGTTEGTVHLTGAQALWQVRNRGGEVNGEYFYGTDWDRVDRQQRMFSGIIDSLRYLSFDEVSNMAYTVLPYVTTDLSADELAGHISNAPAYLSYSLERATFPTDYWQNSYYDYAGSVLEITDWKSLRRDVATFVYENIE